MSIRRRTTVHDLASLRVHPDGSRVQNVATDLDSESNDDASGTRKRKVTTYLKSRLAKSIARDAHGNWIALDAGGKGTVKTLKRRGDTEKRKEVAGRDGEGRNEWRSSSVTRRVEEDDDDEEKSDENLRDIRAKKRKRFYHDLSFLETPQLSRSQSLLSSAIPGPSTQDVQQIRLPVPSSDLLKCIHYFASEFYSSTGRLYDAPSQARKERQERKLTQLRHKVAKRSGQRVLDDPDRASDSGNSKDSGEDEIEREERRSEGVTSDGDEKKRRKTAKSRRKTRGDKEPPPDMYKAFDGSALMAMGMLLQEHVLSMMSTSPPDGWEEQMIAAEVNAGVEIRGGKRQSRAKKKKAEVAEGNHSGSGGEDHKLDVKAENEDEDQSTYVKRENDSQEDSSGSSSSNDSGE